MLWSLGLTSQVVQTIEFYLWLLHEVLCFSLLASEENLFSKSPLRGNMFNSPVPFEPSPVLLFSMWALCRQDRVLGTKSGARESQTKAADGLISASLWIGQAESTLWQYKTPVELHLHSNRAWMYQHSYNRFTAQCYFNIFGTVLCILQSICLQKTFQLQ